VAKRAEVSALKRTSWDQVSELVPAMIIVFLHPTLDTASLHPSRTPPGLSLWYAGGQRSEFAHSWSGKASAPHRMAKQISLPMPRSDRCALCDVAEQISSNRITKDGTRGRDHRMPRQHAVQQSSQVEVPQSAQRATAVFPQRAGCCHSH
jgi:hypothetical protein